VGEVDDRTLIVLSRKRAWRDRLRSYAVVMDGEPVGKIRSGQRLQLPVTPGSHEIFLKIDWCRSPALHVDAQPGEVIELSCESAGPARSGLGDVLHASDQYIRLTRL
jgi:hypothetical protein